MATYNCEQVLRPALRVPHTLWDIGDWRGSNEAGGSDEEDEEGGGVVSGLNNITIETTRTEEEAA